MKVRTALGGVIDGLVLVADSIKRLFSTESPPPRLNLIRVHTAMPLNERKRHDVDCS